MARTFSWLPLVPLAAVAVALALPTPGLGTNTCTKVASPRGSDVLPGTPAQPYRTAQKLASSLRAGDVGCLRAGTYNGNVELTNAGTGSARITLQSYPGERARIVGELAVRGGADYTTVANLDLNGRNPDNWPSPAVSATNVIFEGNDVTNDHTAVCFLLGTATRTRSVIIRDNRIHNCGALPATNRHVGIYVQHADDVEILKNVIYDNADMGIQLYTDAQRTLIKGNVIDGNGEGIIFSGDYGLVASNNLVEKNVITNSRIRNNVESHYARGAQPGRGNLVLNNCIYGGANDDGDGGVSRRRGFAMSGNLVADPQYVNRDAKDFRLAPGSPCAELVAY